MKVMRAHQVEAISRLRKSYSAGKRRPILQLPTGAGKTVIAANLIRTAREKGNKVLFIVDAISLIDQTLEAFYDEGLHSIGVIQADHVMTDYSKPIQIASVQTLQRRPRLPECNLIIIDECHSCNVWLFKQLSEGEWSKVPVIGLSATPWAKGLGNVYDDLITPVTMQQLIDLGHLSTFRVFAPSHPNLGNVSIQAGDYHAKQLAEVMEGDGIIADIVSTWKQLADGRPTIAFCVDRAHAKKVQERFEQAGVPAGYIDAKVERDERKAIRKQLDDGEIKVVTSIGCLTKGVDWAIGCIILARPTKSKMLYVQMVGRGLRVNEGIPDCIILDHSDNTLRMGFVTDIQETELCTGKRGINQKTNDREPLPKECPKCSFLKPPKVAKCPVCEFEPVMVSQIEEADGELAEVGKKPKPVDKMLFYREALGYARQHGKADKFALAMFRAKFDAWPHKKNGVTPLPPSEYTQRWIRSRMIAYAKGRAKANAA